MFTFKQRKKPHKKDFEIIPDGKHLEIKVEDTFHLKNMYKHLHDWLEREGYYDPQTKNENFEDLYYQRTQQNGLMFHHIWWRVLKDMDTKGKYQAFLKIDFQTIAVSKHETMIEGQKFKTYKGEVIVKVKAFLRVDPEDEWNNHFIIKYFQKIMLQRWLRKTINQYKDEIYDDLLDMQRQVKHYMGGKAGLPSEKQWNEGITGI